MIYNIFRAVLWLAGKILYRLRVTGTEHVPPSGGIIVASNHASLLDPPVLGAVLWKRQLSYMAKEELFRYPGFGWLIRQGNAIPIRRGGTDRGTFKAFVKAIKEEGRALVVFPEGTRTHDGNLGPVRRGIGALCLAAGAPVIPAFIRGTYKVWPRWRRFPLPWGRIEVRFGAPVQYAGDPGSDRDEYEALAGAIRSRIEELG